MGQESCFEWLCGRQYDLGVLYYNGEGVPQDYKNALASFEKAARWDHAEALFMIGIMQEFGKGDFLPNHAKAVEDWYIKAVELCNVKAIEKVKRVEENGFSLEVNYQNCPGLK